MRREDSATGPGGTVDPIRTDSVAAGAFGELQSETALKSEGRSVRAASIVTLSFMLAPAAARAQDLGQYCRGIYAPRLGDYAEMDLHTPGARGSGRMRFAVVETERIAGTVRYWLEVTTTGGPDGDRGTIVAQLLVPRYPFDSGDIESYVIQMPGRQPMKIPLAMVRRAAETATGTRIGWEEGCRTARDLGTASIQVAAGAFKVRHLRTNGKDRGDIWLSSAVPFGIVKFTSSDGSSMELRRYGTGARSSLTGAPVEVRISNTLRDSS